MKFFFVVALSFCSLKSFGQTFEQFLNLGYESYLEGNYKEAIKYYDEAKTLDSNNAEVFYLRGASLSVMEKNDEALKDLDKAIELKPDYAEAWYEKGYIIFLLDDPEKAINYFSEAIRLKPSYAEAYINRGTIRCMLEDKEGALEDYKKAETLGMVVAFKCD